MKFANNINGLVVQFKRMDYDEANQWNLLIMERIQPLDYRGSEIEKRELWFDVFADELKQLHSKGFMHRDLKSPSNIPGERFDNILFTHQGLRLIDVGISAFQNQVGDKLFGKYVENELQEMELLNEFFINR